MLSVRRKFFDEPKAPTPPLPRRPSSRSASFTMYKRKPRANPRKTVSPCVRRKPNRSSMSWRPGYRRNCPSSRVSPNWPKPFDTRSATCPRHGPISKTVAWNWTITSVSAASVPSHWVARTPSSWAPSGWQGCCYRLHPHRGRQDEQRRSRGLAHLGARTFAASQDQSYRRAHAVGVDGNRKMTTGKVVLERKPYELWVTKQGDQLTYHLPVESGFASVRFTFAITADHPAVLKTDDERYYFLFAVLHRRYQIQNLASTPNQTGILISSGLEISQTPSGC